MRDTDLMLLAVMVGGVLYMTTADRKVKTETVVIHGPEVPLVDPAKETEMVVDEVEKSKMIKDKFLGGDVPTRAQSIGKYMIDEATKMIAMKNYFDEAQARDPSVYSASWMRDQFPDEYKNWVLARTYCLNRSNEFKNLWLELGQLGAAHEWMARNQWVVTTPDTVLAQLDAYNTGNSASQIAFIQNQTINQVRQDMVAFLGELRQDTGTKGFEDMDSKDKARYKNMEIMMDVDNEQSVITFRDPRTGENVWRRVKTVTRDHPSGLTMTQQQIAEARGSAGDWNRFSTGQDPYRNTRATNGGFDTTNKPLPMGKEADDLFNVSKNPMVDTGAPGDFMYQAPGANSRDQQQYSSVTNSVVLGDQDSNRPPNRPGPPAISQNAARLSQNINSVPDFPFHVAGTDRVSGGSSAMTGEIRDLRGKQPQYSQIELQTAEAQPFYNLANAPQVVAANNDPPVETYPTQLPGVTEIVVPPTGPTKEAPLEAGTKIFGESTVPVAWGQEMITSLDQAYNPQRGQIRKRTDSLDMGQTDAIAQSLKVQKADGGKPVSSMYLAYGN